MLLDLFVCSIITIFICCATSYYFRSCSDNACHNILADLIDGIIIINLLAIMSTICLLFVRAIIND